jgi:hypothetical protein
MSSRKIIFCSFFLFFSGCLYTDEPMPVIVQARAAPSRIVQPKISRPRQTSQNVVENVPRSWLPLQQTRRRWTAVVVHHSGTKTGNLAKFDKWHRESRHWEGVGYHFVIGNGTDSGDGEVEVTFRWRNQMTGAHCGGTPGNWANREAVGICLVGNFNHTLPTPRQMGSLVKLIRFLNRYYGIPNSRIYNHSSTPGAKVTDCPGKRFPMARLTQMIGF